MNAFAPECNAPIALQASRFKEKSTTSELENRILLQQTPKQSIMLTVADTCELFCCISRCFMSLAVVQCWVTC